MSIFISIASYCDPVLPFTLARAHDTAARPQDLHLGVIDQSPSGPSPVDIAATLAPTRITYQRIDPLFSRGPCWARALAMTLYDGEDWFLQLDSHMDFDEGWDERLIAQATALQAGRVGAVISSYPSAFAFENGEPVRRPVTGRILAHVVKPGMPFDPEHPVLSFEAHPVNRDEPVPGFHLGAGCLFAPGKFALEFPYDPALYFHGEEQALAARLFTHGWDIFHMAELPVWHLYNDGSSGGPARPLHWDQAHDRQRTQVWWDLEQRSRKRLADLVAGKPLGAYGLGKVRTMQDYAAFSGIDYAARTIAPRAYKPLAGA
jgi:hypothetical protein